LLDSLLQEISYKNGKWPVPWWTCVKWKNGLEVNQAAQAVGHFDCDSGHIAAESILLFQPRTILPPVQPTGVGVVQLGLGAVVAVPVAPASPQVRRFLNKKL
jgi:hypothetical protein